MLLALYSTDKEYEIHKLIISDLKNKELTMNYIYNRYLPFLWHRNDNEANISLYTVRNKYQKLRDLIKKTRLPRIRKDEALLTFSISKELTAYLNNNSDEKAKEKLNNKLIFSIENYKKELERFKNIMINKDFSSFKINNQTKDYLLAQVSAIYVLFNTGRRMFEIAKTLEVSKSGKTVYYHNLIKKRAENEEKYKAFLIDNDYKSLKKALQNIRKYYDFSDIDNQTFNNNYQKNFNNFLKKNSLFDNISYSKIRDMYTDVALQIYLKEGEDEAIKRSEILAHKPIKLSATDRYKKTKGE